MTPQDTLRQAILNDQFPDDSTDDRMLVPTGEDALRLKRNIAVSAWMSQASKSDINAGSVTWQAEKDALAQGFFKMPNAKDVTDEAVHDLIRSHIQTSDNVRNIAVSSALSGRSITQALNEVDAFSGVSKTRGIRDRYLNQASTVYSNVATSVAPYRSIIEQAVKGIEGYDTKAEGVSDTFTKVAESILPLPPKERLLVINAIGEVGAAAPKEKQAYLQKLITAIDREMKKGVAGTANLAESLFYAGGAVEMSTMNVPDIAKATAEHAQKRRELQILAGQVKMMAHSKINPIEGNNWWEETGIGTARMAPLLAATMINSPASIAIMIGQFRDEASIEAVNAGESLQNAEAIASIAAPIMAGQEFLSNAIPLGKIKIPFIDKWLKAATTSVKSAAIRVATRGAIGTGTEITEEIMQTVTPLVTQDLLSEWQSEWSIESGISKADWDERMPKISDIAKQTFGPALLVSFLMAGKISIADVKNSRALMTSPDYMVATGIAPDLANQITAEGLKGNYTEVDKLFRKGFDKGNKATPEQIKEAESKINVKVSNSLEYYNKLRKEFGIGTVSNIGNGKYQFTTPILKDAKGEIIDSGISAQFNSISEANEAQMLHIKNRQASIRKAEQEFITSMNTSLEEKQGLDIALMDYDMFTKQFTELFPSTTAQVEERIKLTGQIDGAVEDVSLENATLESEANDNKNYRILGTNSIEQRDGISVGVITLYKGGSLLDLIEESAEVGVKRLMSDPTSRTKLILQIRDVEAKMKDQAMQMGQKHMPLIATTDDDKVSNMEIIEAFSHIAKSYYVQTAKAVERPTFTPNMPLNLYLGSLQSSIAGMELKDAIDLVGEKTLNILYRAAQLKAIHDANGLNQDFVAALEKSVGLNVSNRNADAVVDTAAGIAADAGVTMSMGRAQLEPYKDRSGEDAGSPLTDTEIREGIEDEQGTQVESPIDIADLTEVLDDPSLPDIPWGDSMTSFSMTPGLSPWKKITREDLKKAGKKAFAFYADRMRVGTYSGIDPNSGISIPLQGGFDFAAQIEMIKNNIAWAVSDEKTVKSMITSAIRTGGYAIIALFSRGNVTGNATFLQAYFEELRWNIKQGKITEQQALDFFHEAKQSAGVKNNAIPSAKGTINKATGEKIPPTLERLKEVDEKREAFAKTKWTSLDEVERVLGSLSFKLRGSGFFKTTVNENIKRGVHVAAGIMGKQELVNAGMPDVAKMVELMEEPKFTNLPLGTIVGIVQIDPNQKVQTAKELGVTPHLSYPYVVRGKRVGVFKKEHHIEDFIPLKPKSSRIMEGEAMAATISFSLASRSFPKEERITPENKVAPSINGKPAADIFEEVKKRHGITRSIYEAGYVLPDGTMLDFSGKSQVGDYQRGEDGVFRVKAGIRDWMKDQRSMDHREIEWEDMPNYTENWERMVGFLRLGAVRIDANSGMISMHSRAKITSAQASVLKSIVTSADGAYVDLEDDANNRSSMQLDGGKWGKVNGLLTQWANGETPEFEGTTFSIEKANRKNSLRVLLTKRALTDAALAQASWKDWYSEHKATLDEFFGDSAELFQKILSVTSQASSVKANVGLALKAFGQLMRGEEFDGKLRGEEKSGYLPAVISNLNAVKNNLVANGRKIANYTAANEGDLSRVVVDRHIARLLFGVDTPSKSQYDKAEKILTKIANEIGWSPSQVQAALWAYSIVKSGETPESYGAYLKKLESKPLTRKELKNGLTGNQLTKRIGNITRGGDGLASVGTGRGRYSSTSPTFSISRSDFTGRIEQSLRPLFEGSPDAKLKIGMMALKRAQAISSEALYNVGRPGAAKRKLAEMEASRIAKLGKVTDKTPDWVKKSLEKETTPEQAKAAMLKDKLNGWIQLHDAIVSSMPTEIRGTIGSISTLVKLSSDEARLKFIEERIPKMEKAVERYLKKEYGERIDKMLESAAVKGKAGEIPKSKFIVTVQDELNTIIDMASLSTDDTVKEAARYEAEIISAQTAEDAADALTKSQLLEVFGDLYGKQTTAEEMDVAHEYLKDLMTQGRNARKIIDEARAAEIAKMVEQAKADAFAGAANAATVQAGKDKGKGTTKGMMKGLLRELGSHRFVLSSIFGRSNKTADVFDERMILGVNAFETTQAARKKSLRDFMRALYGTKSKIKLDKELEKLETKVERSRVTYLSGEIRESDTKTVEEVAKIIKSPSTFGYSAEEAKLWEDEMDAWSNLPNARKRNLTIDRIKTPGTRIEIPLSQMEAVYMAMALRQPGILDQQSVHGYDHVTQTELEAFMSDDAKNWLAWFGAEYSAEYDTANEVFMKLFHTRMPQIQFYAPLLKNHQGNQANLDPLNSGVVSQSVNPGAVKSRRGRTSSLRIESALAVYQAHFVQMDYWVHMAEYLRDTQAVMLNADVQNAIKSGHGAEAMQTLSAWIQLEMSRGVGKGALVMHSSKLMRNLKSGVAMKALAFNIGTSIKTLSSVFYSLGEIPITRWPAAFTRGVEHWGKMWDTNIIQNRLELGGTPEIRHILANAGKSKNAILRLVENALVFGSVPTQYADAVLTSYSAAMVYGDRFAQAKDAGAGDDAAHKYAAREMEIAVSRTAQPNDWSGRSLIENDASGVFNLLSMFSSDPRQKLGLVGEAIMKWKRGGATNEEAMRKVLAYWVIPGLMFQVANAVTRSLFKDDDKEWELDNFIRAAIVGPLQGLFLLGAAAEFFIASAVAAATEQLTGEKQDAPRNWRSSTNPMVDMSDQFLQSIKKLPENMENEDYLGGAWQIMKAGGAMVTPFSPAGSAPGIADRVFKDTSTLFYGKED